ncbi:alpha-mannosyltransferase, partial [Globomyces pollinis-pini]
LDGQLFSWIRPSWKNTIQLRESYSESGIVMCVGNKHVESAIATIKIIREMHESNLPIEIFYTGVKDLKMKNRNRLESISGVKTIDITKIIDSNILTIAKSGVKPFALLVSSFEHAALIDAEVTFLKTPNSLFETNQYLKTGSLFFKDRTIFKPKDSSLKWFRELLPTKSKFAKSLRIFNGESAFEQGSGVVVLNKKDHFLGLLATCVLNAGSFKTETYKNTLREKETFWLGMEIMQESYAFNEQLPGVLGVVEEKSTEYEVCAKQLLQFDEMGQPFWFTGNVHQQKYS